VKCPIFSLIRSESPFWIYFNDIELFLFAYFVVLDFFVEVVKYRGYLLMTPKLQILLTSDIFSFSPSMNIILFHQIKEIHLWKETFVHPFCLFSRIFLPVIRPFFLEETWL
jgi:hypothetical protein